MTRDAPRLDRAADFDGRDAQLHDRPRVTDTVSAHARAVERVVAVMRAQLSDPPSLGEMADIACLSPFHFNRIFRSQVGLPPREYLATLRMQEAKRRLLSTSLSVTEVCFDLGYASLGTFATRFREFVGLSPVQLRRFAQDFDPPTPHYIASRQRAKAVAAGTMDGLSGVVSVPAGFDGLIFVGLFSDPIPRSRPEACQTLLAPGPFRLGPVSDGTYYLLAAAVPWSPRLVTYLLPDPSWLVATGSQPVRVQRGRARSSLDLVFRAPRATDPPVVGVFPPLLAMATTIQVGTRLEHLF
jgi:AraC family transcriptional regulator